jgi:hypothetical protein
MRLFDSFHSNIMIMFFLKNFDFLFIFFVKHIPCAMEVIAAGSLAALNFSAAARFSAI